jgi:hypothetical protein
LNRAIGHLARNPLTARRNTRRRRNH